MALLQGLRPRLNRALALRAVSLVCLLSLCACYCAMTPGGDVMVLSRTRQLPVYSVERDDKVLAISFDAAWGGSQTPALLDILDEYGVKTTFFLVGIWVERFPELVQEIIARGHEIGNHSTSHPEMSKLSEEKIREELAVTSDRIEALTGVRPRSSARLTATTTTAWSRSAGGGVRMRAVERRLAGLEEPGRGGARPPGHQEDCAGRYCAVS